MTEYQRKIALENAILQRQKELEEQGRNAQFMPNHPIAAAAWLESRDWDKINVDSESRDSVVDKTPQIINIGGTVNVVNHYGVGNIEIDNSQDNSIKSTQTSATKTKTYHELNWR